MNTTNDKTRLTDRKRAEILAAAVSEFQENGYEGTSMDRVATAAGASKRTVYNHFKSKDALFTAIIKEARDQMGEMGAMPYDPETDVEPQLVGVGDQIASVITSPAFINLARVIISRFLHVPSLGAGTLKNQEEYEKNLINWIEAATKDGRLDVKDTSRASIEFIGLIELFGFWPQVLGTDSPLSKKDREAVVRSGSEMFLSRYQTN